MFFFFLCIIITNEVMCMMNDVIVALATPPMNSALAIIRVSGEDAIELVEKMFSKELKNVLN